MQICIDVGKIENQTFPPGKTMSNEFYKTDVLLYISFEFNKVSPNSY
jgi:hypothetical protein